jgi:hypothetical protein
LFRDTVHVKAGTCFKVQSRYGVKKGIGPANLALPAGDVSAAIRPDGFAVGGDHNFTRIPEHHDSRPVKQGTSRRNREESGKKESSEHSANSLHWKR